MSSSGAYDAARASALSGVPRSTIHYWAREAILVPSVSSARVKLWSYKDLMGLRVISWLRSKKTVAHGPEIPRTSMRAIRRALEHLRRWDKPLWEPAEASVLVDEDGELHVQGPSGPEPVSPQLKLEGAPLNLVAPFTSLEGLRGPDLARPRPELRIVPSRLSGSPLVVDTRIETRVLRALDRDGLSTESILALYPVLTRAHLESALDLERQLEENLKPRRAA